MDVSHEFKLPTYDDFTAHGLEAIEGIVHDELCPICLDGVSELIHRQSEIPGKAIGGLEQDSGIARRFARTVSCKHKFHHGCLLVWLSTHQTCPMCRTQLYQNPTLLQPASLEPNEPEDLIELLRQVENLLCDFRRNYSRVETLRQVINDESSRSDEDVERELQELYLEQELLETQALEMEERVKEVEELGQG